MINTFLHRYYDIIVLKKGKTMKPNKITLFICSSALLLVTGCLEISVNQPTQVPSGGTVSAVVQVIFTQDSQIGADDDGTMMFAINKPTA